MKQQRFRFYACAVEDCIRACAYKKELSSLLEDLQGLHTRPLMPSTFLHKYKQNIYLRKFSTLKR